MAYSFTLKNKDPRFVTFDSLSFGECGYYRDGYSELIFIKVAATFGSRMIKEVDQGMLPWTPEKVEIDTMYNAIVFDMETREVENRLIQPCTEVTPIDLKIDLTMKGVNKS